MMADEILLKRRCNFKSNLKSTAITWDNTRSKPNATHVSTRDNLRKQISNLYGEAINSQIRFYEKLEIKRAAILCDLQFLRSCRDKNITPTCFKLTFHQSTAASKRILKRAEMSLLRNELHSKRFQLDRLNKDLLALHLDLSSQLHPLLWDKIKQLTTWRADSTFFYKQERHLKKLKKLENDKKPPNNSQQHLKQLVYNVSNRELTKAETDVLTKGFNYAIAPQKIPTEDIICAVEASLTKLNTDEADKIRHQVTNVLYTSHPPRKNLQQNEFKALQTLRRDNDIIILPADKGNATVVMDRKDYETKLTNLLQDSTYKPINTDPTTYLEKLTKKKIISSNISKEIHHTIIPREKSSRCPKLYGLPKIHKEGIPLRPIVSSRGAPLQNLARYLAKQLQPHAETAASHVQNSYHFLEMIKDLHLEQEDLLVSFDVVSLFTQVPIKETLEIIKNKYQPAKHLMELTEHCLTNTYFIYKGQRYKQIEGAPMGSPLSPVIANLFMEEFESRALANATLKPKLWLRYIDDTFVIWPHGQEKLNNFLTHLNSIHPKIKFTMETETNHQLPFLDVLIYKKTDGTLGHTIYQKKTHTNRYLNAQSHHHPAQINSVAKTLIARTKRLADKTHIKTELCNLTKVLTANGFHKSKITNLIHKETTLKHNRDPEDEQTYGTAVLPYIKGTTDKISKILRRHHIRTAFRTDRKIAAILRNPKDKIDLENQGIYEIPCASCTATYVGQTNRRISTRLDEHKNAVKKLEHTSSLVQHMEATGHSINFNGTKTLATIENPSHRIIREAIEIEKRPESINRRDDSNRLSIIWKPALTNKKISTLQAIQAARHRQPPPPDASTSSTPHPDTQIKTKDNRPFTRSQAKKSNPTNQIEVKAILAQQ